MHPLIVIPARMGSTRLKDKPLRLINGIPLIVHVHRRAVEADIGPVLVSTDSAEVAKLFAGDCLVHSPQEHCGSDRCYWASKWADSELGLKHDHIINLQGDLPFIDPQILRDLWAKRQESRFDIVTACHTLHWVGGPKIFERCSDDAHIGVYAFTAASLKRFAALPVHDLEIKERLEQIRAVNAGMRFDAIWVDHMPLEINTESDLYHANLIAGFCRAENLGTCDARSDGDPTFDDWWDTIQARLKSGDNDLS